MADTLSDKASQISQAADTLARQASELSHDVMLNAASNVPHEAAAAAPFFIVGLTVFVLACFVGYYVVWRVTPALHSPLMAVTNAISSVIIVGALIAVGLSADFGPKLMGFLAVTLASVNIFGGFIVTQRMLSMFSKKKK
jgi:NAD(P) transhydrogenase subunit alpha